MILYHSQLNNIIYIISYVIAVLCIIYILCKGLIRILYPFWAIQPVFNYYNVYYWLFPNKIIHQDSPKLNKYVDLKNIKVIDIHDANTNTIQALHIFIKNNYLQTSISKYNPSYSHIVDYLYGAQHPSYLCIYKNPHSSDITGATTTRSLDVKLPNNSIIPTYYVDHLCVSSKFRKKDIAPKLIQTFYYLVSRYNKKVKTYFFKKEGKTMNIVPLTKYITFGYKLDTITSLYDNTLEKQHLHQIKLINEATIVDVWHFIEARHTDYKISIKPSFSTLKYIVKSKLYYIYVRQENKSIQDVYIVRNCATTYYDENAIEVIASISSKNKTAYIQGFIKSIDICCKLIGAKNVLIENIGDTAQFVDYLKKHKSLKTVFTQSPTAYYFYNYAIRPINSPHCFILA